MSQPDAQTDLAKSIAEEHVALRVEIRNLQSDLDELDKGISGDPARQLLLEDLREFRGHLARHFQFEERGGYQVGVDAGDPTTQREVADLIGEHRRFEADTDVLIERLTDATTAPKDLRSTFRTELRAMLGRLAIHESKENALFQRVLSRDVGRSE